MAGEESTDATDALVWPVPSPWRATLLAALGQVRERLLLVSPFIKAEVVALVEEALRRRTNADTAGGGPLSVRVLTRVRLEDLASGASDLAALERLLEWPDRLPGSAVDLRALDRVHAKVWVCDSDVAIAGSGNATLPGLERNAEYGLGVRDPAIVARMLADWQELWDEAAPVVVTDLALFHRYFTAVEADERFSAAQRELERLKAEMARDMSVPARLGASSSRAATAPARTTAPAPRFGAKSGGITLRRRVAAHGGQVREVIVVRAADLLHALLWHTKDSAEWPGWPAAIQLECTPEPIAEPQLQLPARRVYRLTLLHAEGRSAARSTFPAWTAIRADGDDPAPWAIKLNQYAAEQLWRLVDSVRLGYVAPEEHLCLCLDTPQDRLSAWIPADTSSPHVAPAPSHTPFSDRIGVVPSARTGEVILLQPPHCLRVSAHELSKGLMHLQDVLANRRLSGEDQLPPVLEVRLEAPGLRICAGRGRNYESEVAIPVHGEHPLGPPVSFTFDRDTLLAAIDAHHIDGFDPHTWVIRLDTNADYLQFEPEPSPLKGLPGDEWRWCWQLNHTP